MKKRAFLLVSTLLILIVLLLTGMGLMSSEASRYRASLRVMQAVQARQLALAGMEDARAKLEMDILFPPPPSTDTLPNQIIHSGANSTQPIFTYSEVLPIPGVPAVNGTYFVTVNSSACTANFTTPAPFDPSGPRQVILIESIGTVGDPDSPTSRYTIRAEVDVSQLDRVSGNANTRYFRYTHIEDLGIP